MRLSSGMYLGSALIVAVAPAAMATVYQSQEQSIRSIFPGRDAGDFQVSTLRLSKEQRKAISSSTGLSVRDQDISVWKAADGSRMYVDKVVGKHEFITFSAGIGPDGKIRGVEILEYRETYGGEVRRSEWLKQFSDKKLGSGFKLGKDIRNISGATLSCHSVTEGVNRLLAIRELTK